MNEELWSEFYNEACHAMQENDLDYAEVNWRRAWNQVRNLDHDDGRYLMTLEYFVDLLCQKQKLDEAGPLMHDLLEAKCQVFGDLDLRVAITANALAGLYFSQKDYKKAEEFCEQALNIHELELGPEHPDVFLILQNLAMLYHAREAFEKAEPAYERAIELAKKIHGPQAQLTQAVTENYMALLKVTGQNNKAQKAKRTLVLPVFDRLMRAAGEDQAPEQIATNQGFTGEVLSGVKKDPRKSNQCLYRIKPLPVPDKNE